jgi:hypothetical protein
MAICHPIGSGFIYIFTLDIKVDSKKVKWIRSLTSSSSRRDGRSEEVKRKTVIYKSFSFKNKPHVHILEWMKGIIIYSIR